MRWFSAKQSDIVPMQCTNTQKSIYLLALSPNSKNVEKGEMEDNNVRYISVRIPNRPSLQEIKDKLIELQKEYDVSHEVNQFIVEGHKAWFNKETRMNLTNTATLCKVFDDSTPIPVWFTDDYKVELTPDKVIECIAVIENYATKCFNVTKSHLLEIAALETIDDCLAYDITAGYPEQISLTFND